MSAEALQRAVYPPSNLLETTNFRELKDKKNLIQTIRTCTYLSLAGLGVVYRNYFFKNRSVAWVGLGGVVSIIVVVQYLYNRTYTNLKTQYMSFLSKEFKRPQKSDIDQCLTLLKQAVFSFDRKDITKILGVEHGTSIKELLDRYGLAVFLKEEVILPPFTAFEWLQSFNQELYNRANQLSIREFFQQLGGCSMLNQLTKKITNLYPSEECIMIIIEAQVKRLREEEITFEEYVDRTTDFNGKILGLSYHYDKKKWGRENVQSWKKIQEKILQNLYSFIAKEGKIEDYPYREFLDHYELNYIR